MSTRTTTELAVAVLRHLSVIDATQTSGSDFDAQTNEDIFRSEFLGRVPNGCEESPIEVFAKLSGITKSRYYPVHINLRTHYRTGQQNDYYNGTEFGETVVNYQDIDAPGNVTASVNGNTVHIEWDEIPGASCYRVSFYDGDGNFINEYPDPVEETFLEVEITTAGDWSFRVQACFGDYCSGSGDADDCGPLSDPSNTVTIDLDLDVQASEVTSSSAVLTWNPITGATGYELLIDGAVSGDIP